MREEEPEYDPMGPSYPESAIQYWQYRVGLVCLAALFIVIGKSNLPTDQVPCLQDQILKTLNPVTEFYKSSEGFGIFLITLLQIILDVELIVFGVFWVLKGVSLRYPICLALLGFFKIMMNIIFEVRPIQEAFTKRVLPSFFFADNFENTYFFSGIMAFLLFNLLEVRAYIRDQTYGTPRILILFQYIQAVIVVYALWILLSMQLNYFMDVVIGLIFAHFFFVQIEKRSAKIDNKVVSLLNHCHQKVESQKDEKSDTN